jgi:mitogen-activated protein kinase 1/3
MLTFQEYTFAIDVWSVGCILAEMLSGKPLFPGRDYHHQLNLILDVRGTPSLDDFYAISSHRSRDYLRALPFKKKKPFATLYPNANPDALDLLERMLAFNPRKRITVEECLAHPYLSPYVRPGISDCRGGRTCTDLLL